MAGRSQYSGKLSDFNQNQLELILDAQTDIDAAVAAVQATADAIKNTDIANLSTKVNGIGWWAKYTPFAGFGNGSLTTTPQTMLNLAGKGYLAMATIKEPVGYDSNIKITVDGVIKVQTKNPVDGYAHGYIWSDLLMSQGAATLGVMQWAGGVLPVTSFTNYPYVGAGGNTVVTSAPIFFNTSLKIEMWTDIGTPATQYQWIGGME